jgi:hypothetical protein
VAAVGLAAVDFAAKGGASSEDWKAQQLAVVEQAKKPKSQLLLMPVTSIQKLVEGVAANGSCAAPK